jgi:hypothetical protein
MDKDFEKASNYLGANTCNNYFSHFAANAPSPTLSASRRRRELTFVA